MSLRLEVPPRRTHITKKVRIADQRTLYISVHEDPYPTEIFRRVKGSECTPETITLYDVIARLMSVGLQYGASLEKLGDLLTGAQVSPCELVSGHDRLKHCSSLIDLLGRHLIEYCRRDELAQKINEPLNQGGALCTEQNRGSMKGKNSRPFPIQSHGGEARRQAVLRSARASALPGN